MISAISAGPAVAVGNNSLDYRYRPQMGERTMLQDSVPTAPRDQGASNDAEFARPDRQPPAQPEPTRRDSSSMFAAAVIAGALSPTPKTLEELMLRIGTSTIPEESEARLKDLLA